MKLEEEAKKSRFRSMSTAHNRRTSSPFTLCNCTSDQISYDNFRLFMLNCPGIQEIASFLGSKSLVKGIGKSQPNGGETVPERESERATEREQSKFITIRV